MKKFLKYLMVIVIASPIALSGSYAFAKRDGGTPPGFEKGEKKGFDESGAPKGWSQGEKKGWDGEAMPPGLFKKEGEDEGSEGTTT